MYPTGYVKGQPVPLVLEIHGGPHSWHPQVALLGLYQALAAAGYVVVLPNPRGSHGYGEEFARACVGDWGGADFEDLMGAVDKLVHAGVADPDHLYVTGYSYGGYMTSWAVGQTDRFAAACVAAPVTDLATIWGTTDIPNFVEHEVGAPPVETAGALRQALADHLRRQRHDARDVVPLGRRPALPDQPGRGVLPGAPQARP